jgi:hypothetical protein
LASRWVPTETSDGERKQKRERSGWRGKTTLLLTESDGGKRRLWLTGGPKGTASPKIAGAGDRWGAGDGAPMSRARERQGWEAGLWLREGAQLHWG